MTEASGETVRYRSTGADAAIVFVHGFGSSARRFGGFAQLLAAEPELAAWDLHGVSYTTDFGPDIQGLWEEDPTIPILATYLRSLLALEPLDDYGCLALVAHSMGGLVVQEALLGDQELTDRVGHLFLFGTPSNGVRSARWFSFLNRQVDGMEEGGPYIRDLRRRWEESFGPRPPFDMWTVAGDQDAFVPSTSSLAPFPPEMQVVVPGDHFQILDIEDAGAMSGRVVIEGLVGRAAPAGPWNSARAAVERREFQRAIREFLPHAGELGEGHLVDLAIALEAVGRVDEAAEILWAECEKHGFEAKGALADRLKGSWLAEGKRDDAETALELYSQALATATESGDQERAFKAAINVAFLQLLYKGDRTAARTAAERALQSCGDAAPGFLRTATDGESSLHLGDWDRAMRSYSESLALQPTAYEVESVYRQASSVLAELRQPEVQARLDEVLRPAPAETLAGDGKR